MCSYYYNPRYALVLSSEYTKLQKEDPKEGRGACPRYYPQGKVPVAVSLCMKTAVLGDFLEGKYFFLY